MSSRLYDVASEKDPLRTIENCGQNDDAMRSRAITAPMVRTAWKMVATIFEAHRCSARDQNLMLNLVMMVSLHDLLDDRLVWKTRPPRPWRLEFRGKSVAVLESPGEVSLRARLLDHEVDDASARAEDLFDRYQLDEDERDTLFTALPCLGLKAMEDWVRWTEEPPFPEARK